MPGHRAVLDDVGNGRTIGDTWRDAAIEDENVIRPFDRPLRENARRRAGGWRLRPSASQTPWQEIQRAVVGPMDSGAILEGAEKYRRIARTMGLPRDNH